MNPTQIKSIRRAAASFTKTILIVSPPRVGSTAFARTLWRDKSIGFYCHEPFERCYFDGAALHTAASQIENPIPVDVGLHSKSSGLVVKEMSYQVGQHFVDLAAIATAPLVFVIRSPYLNIASRQRKKLEVGSSPFFPIEETGWTKLRDHVSHCDSLNIPYLVVDAEDFRASPQAVFPEVFRQLGLHYTADVLKWEPRPDLDLDNLDGRHSHLYEQVLLSRGIEPENNSSTDLEQGPDSETLQEHLAECLVIYDALRRSDKRVRPSYELCDTTEVQGAKFGL